MNQKYTNVSMYCSFSYKTEKVFIEYIAGNEKLIVARACGCEKNYHNCNECTNCLEKAKKIFTDSFEAN